LLYTANVFCFFIKTAYRVSIQQQNNYLSVKKLSYFSLHIHDFHLLHKTTKQRDKQIISTISGHKLQKVIIVDIITTKSYKIKRLNFIKNIDYKLHINYTNVNKII